jgi:hypothetical protein
MAKLNWKKSKAKALLRNDFVTGELPLNADELTAEQIFETRAEYSATEWRLFPERLIAIRKATAERMEEAKDDEAAFAHDRLMYPEVEFEIDGSYKWHGSEAEELIKEDVQKIIEEGRKNDPNVTPTNLWLERIEYQLFHPDKFANHFYQAFKRVKFDNFVELKKQQAQNELEEI